MGLKHLIKIETELQSNPNKEYAQSHFTNKMKIDYNQVQLILQYLWQKQLIVLTEGGKYKWKIEQN